MSVAWWVVCLVLGPVGFVSVLLLIVAVCRVGADADRRSEELLCRRLQWECAATPRRQPAGGAEIVPDRVRRGYRPVHR